MQREGPSLEATALSVVLRGDLACERGDGGGFVVLDVEDGVELGDLEKVVDLLGEIEQLELAAAFLTRGEGADQLADAGAVDVADVSEVQQNVLGALGQRVANGIANRDTAFSEGDASAEIENGDAVDLAGLRLSCSCLSLLYLCRRSAPGTVFDESKFCAWM